MGIFIKRPLCLFCFSFIGASLLGCAFGGKYNLFAFFGSLLVASLFFALSFVHEKRKFGFIEAAIALLFVALAFLSLYLSVTLEKNKATEYCGEGKTVRFLVLDKDYGSRYSSKYTGRLISVNGTDVDIPAELVSEYDGEYAIGDVVFTFGNIELLEAKEDGKIIILPSDTVLSIETTVEAEQAIVSPCDGYALSILCARIREYVSSVFLDRLGFEEAALSIGLLSGDKTRISPELIRDFRRSGISHVLAVSGLHLSLVIGAAELLLRRFYIKKPIRCIMLTVLAFFLLMLSGFSPSACRSVIMLLCVYFIYLLFRDSDALTSLGVAGFFIILISPKSVGDIGFWLSFLATFGLVTWLTLFDSARRKKRKEKLSKIIASAFRKLVLALATTFCATISILFVTWMFFGEVSIIGLVTNLVVTPLCELYLILSIIIFLLGGLPYLSAALSFCAEFLCKAITSLSAFFSSLEGAVISLRYPFAEVIIIVMSVLLLLLLIIKLRRKILILAVPFAAIISFCVCLAVFNYTNDGLRVNYVNNGSRDSLALVEKSTAVIFDVSDGVYTPFYDSVRAAGESYATETGAVVLTHYHTKYISSLDNICRNEMVRRIYIPLPEAENEVLIAADIGRSAKENGVALVTYEYGDVVSLGEELRFLVRQPDKCSYSTKKIINFTVFYKDKMLYYADSSWEHGVDAEKVAKSIELCDAVIFGAHGPERKGKNESYPLLDYPDVIAVGAVDEGKTVVRFQIN